MDRNKVENIVRKFAERLGTVTEEQIQSLINRLLKFDDTKTAVDSLAQSVDSLFRKPEQKENYDACMQDLLDMSEGSYSSVEEIETQVAENKAKNYTPRKYFY